jgi:FkbM family methyltransferase
MLIKNLDQYIKNKKGVLHVGACEAEERDWYYTKGFEPIYYIEANPYKSFIIQDNIREYENQYFISQAISDTEETLDFYITNNDGVSSSLLFPNLRPEIYDNQSHTIEEIIQVQTKTLKNVIERFSLPMSEINFLTMDVEGSELKVLKSLKGWVSHFDYILAEYHTFENYIGCPMVDDLILFLKQFGFKEVVRVDSGEKWGDILFEKVL